MPSERVGLVQLRQEVELIIDGCFRGWRIYCIASLGEVKLETPTNDYSNAQRILKGEPKREMVTARCEYAWWGRP